MTALAADKQIKTRPARLAEYPVAAVQIFKGSLVCVNAAGFLTPAAKTADNSEVVGIASMGVDNSGGNAGDLTCMVESGMIVYPVCVGMTQAKVGNNAYAIDDNTVGPIDGTGVTALSPLVGRIVEYISATSAGIFIPEGANGERRTEVEVGLVAGGAGGAHTLTGINLGDRILFVGHFSTAAAIATLADLTSEFSITAADTIDNTAGTDTTNDQLMVIYAKRQ